MSIQTLSIKNRATCKTKINACIIILFHFNMCFLQDLHFSKKKLKHGYITYFFSALDSRVPSAHP